MGQAAQAADALFAQKGHSVHIGFAGAGRMKQPLARAACTGDWGLSLLKRTPALSGHAYSEPVLGVLTTLLLVLDSHADGAAQGRLLPGSFRNRAATRFDSRSGPPTLYAMHGSHSILVIARRW